MAIVKTPVPGYTGHVGDDLFVDGVCQVPDSKLAYYQRHGYIIEAEEQADQQAFATTVVPEVSETNVVEIPGAKAKKAELIAYAHTLGIDTDGLDVAALREAIEAHAKV